MLVALDRQAVETDRASRRAPLPFVAQDEAPPDVEVAVEPEALVERSALAAVGPPERLAVALDGVDVPGRRVLELAQVRRGDPPAADDSDRRVGEGLDQRRHDVAGRLDAGVEEDDDRADRAPQADVRGRPVTEALARPDDLDRQPDRGVESPPARASCSALGRRPRRPRLVPSGACARRPARRPGEVVRPVRRDRARPSRGPTDGSSKRDGTLALDP